MTISDDHLDERLKEICESVERMANGDLVTPLLIDGVGDDISGLEKSLETMRTTMSSTIGGLESSIASLGEALRLLKRTTISKTYVESVIACMHDSLLVMRPNGAIVSVNQSGCTLLGYTESELQDKLYKFIFGENSIVQLLKECLVSGKVANTRATFITKADERIPVLLTGSVLRDSDNKINGLVIVAKDLREHEELTKLNAHPDD